jgi:hypothetical protein
MMDFDRKEFIMQRIIQNAMKYQNMMMGMPGMMGMGGIPGAAPTAQGSDVLGGEAGTGESSVTENARQRVAEASSPT